MTRLETKQNWLLDSDASILAEVRKAIRQDDGIRALDIGSFSVSVKEGLVLLTGHLSKKHHRERIEAMARSVPGVHAVQNNLVVDSDLTIQVAAHLAMEKRNRCFIFPVGCAHGWVRLGGVVPRRELQMAAEEIAGQVPTVRGVLSRPRVLGRSFETESRPIQPQVQAKVFDSNRQGGVITQVVIQPRNRLVTHAVVGVSSFHDHKFVFHEYLVPVEAMGVVRQESIFLKRQSPPLDHFPVFEPSRYALAPVDWQPPYPYEAGTVRWICDEAEKAIHTSSTIRTLARQA